MPKNKWQTGETPGDYNPEPVIEPVIEKKQIFETKKQSGKVRNITPSKIIIVYGNNFGTSIPFDAIKHKDLKINDPIEF